MKGLCHSCLTSDVELITEKGQVLCMDCYHSRQKQSRENREIIDPPTFEKLRKKWEK
jgi:hypothetical protein